LHRVERTRTVGKRRGMMAKHDTSRVPVLARRKTDTSEIHGTPGFCFKCNQPALVEEGLDLEPMFSTQ